MTASARVLTTMAAGIGGETVRAGNDSTFTITESDGRNWTLAAAAVGGFQTAWATAVGPIPTPRYVGIFVDPDNDLTGDPAVTVELTLDAVVVVLNVVKSVPLQLGSATAGGADGILNGALTLVRLRNDHATQDVRCRVVILGP